MTTGPVPARPRIGIVAKRFPKLSESFVLEEVLGLERRRLNLHLFALHGADEHPPHARVADVRARISVPPRTGMRRTFAMLGSQLRQALRHPLRYLRTRAFARAHHGPGWRSVFALAVWMAEECAAEQIDALHVHFANEPTDVAELAHRLSGIPFSVSGHAKDLYCGDLDALRRKLSAARFVATCTGANVDFLHRHVAPSTPVHRIYHGIDTRLFSPAPPVDRADDPAAPPLILAVGRLRPKKGFATLLHAVHRLHADGLPIRCAIVGYGPELANLRALATTLGIDGQVEFPGALPHERLLDWYRRATLFCLPCEIQQDGDRDGIPNVMLEAMAMALPVVTTPVSGIPEVIRHGENGWMVPPADPAALSGLIGELLADSARRRAVGRQARQTVMTMFDSDRNLATLATLLLDLRALPPLRPVLTEQSVAR